jgi:hypothetical protein
LRDKERFEEGLIGIGPSNRFPERSNRSICGSENKNAERFPLKWFELMQFPYVSEVSKCC